MNTLILIQCSEVNGRIEKTKTKKVLIRMDLDFNKIFRSGNNSRNGIYKRFIYWFCKRYFSCDIHPTDNIDKSVYFAHSALGVVINKDSIIDENVVIQHHVTIGRNDHGVPHIRGGHTLVPVQWF